MTSFLALIVAACLWGVAVAVYLAALLLSVQAVW